MIPGIKEAAVIAGKEVLGTVAKDVALPLIKDVAIPAMKNGVEHLKEKVSNETSQNKVFHDTENPDKTMELAINNETNSETRPESVESESAHTEGGSYREVKEHSDSNLYEVHHMPADCISPLKMEDGPTIKMEKSDHLQTASWGCSNEAKLYREKQKELIDSGDFRGAVQMDIDDIKSKFDDKYNKGISQMLDYVDKLETEKKI